jgi:(4-(4-[2-(gamma-L-glutamylamino)ethyl]phenoxymethyl)furan-2-yl)methanamine synthase
MAVTAGYDVGGAHLKVALVDGGRAIAVKQIPCQLWRGVDRLDAAFAVAGPLTARARHHAATMTGELCENFPDRRTGVETLVDRLVALLGSDVRIWMGPRGFGNACQARQVPAAVGSTNFLATAELVAQRLGDALLIDMGSTTTNIIATAGGRASPRGLTDGERLATGELAYTGLTRTDVSAVAQAALFQGRRQGLAAGRFATMADVRRITGELPQDLRGYETADGRGTSLAECVARLARCFGRDGGDAGGDAWREAARHIADQQMRDIRAAIGEVLAATAVPEKAPVIAAGVGAILLDPLASELGRPCILFGDLIDAEEECRIWATRCAPAVAIALLAGSKLAAL